MSAGVRFLQKWLDEPDESIARYAKAFYLLTFLFLGVFAVQMALFVFRGEAEATSLVGPIVNLFLAVTFYNLALDGRRSYKALKAKADKAGNAGGAGTAGNADGPTEPGLHPYG